MQNIKKHFLLKKKDSLQKKIKKQNRKLQDKLEIAKLENDIKLKEESLKPTFTKEDIQLLKQQELKKTEDQEKRKTIAKNIFLGIWNILKGIVEGITEVLNYLGGDNKKTKKKGKK